MEKLIYVIEDDESIRELISMALTSFSYQVVSFDNAEEALKVIDGQMPDLALFDIMLPGMSGLEATKRLRQHPKAKDLPIILLTAKDTEIDKVAGLDSGADDYITKPFGVMELGARVRSIFRRLPTNEKESAGTEIVTADFTINTETREVIKNGEQISLTFKEYELLRILIKERNRIVPRNELLNEVWGFDFLGESRTLDIHIRTLRQKLGDNADAPKYIKTVRNVGYRFIGESS
ncbi:MAG: response regulator transcription factor [Turicibacter sp.]|nr:response regulator transcription factor [Turicibacter sp.]